MKQLYKQTKAKMQRSMEVNVIDGTGAFAQLSRGPSIKFQPAKNLLAAQYCKLYIINGLGQCIAMTRNIFEDIFITNHETCK